VTDGEGEVSERTREGASQGGVSLPEKGERRTREGGVSVSEKGERRNRTHTGKEGTRQCKTNSRHKIIQTLSEVAHKNSENHFPRRTERVLGRVGDVCGV
jgi:hypothetical protein